MRGDGAVEELGGGDGRVFGGAAGGDVVGPGGVEDGGAAEGDGGGAEGEDGVGVLARPDLAGGEQSNPGGEGGADEGEHVLLRILCGQAADVPAGGVDEVGAVVGEPLGDLEVVVEIQAARVAEVFEGEAHADREACAGSGAARAKDVAYEAGAPREVAAPAVVARIHRARQELRQEVPVRAVK